MTISVLGGFKKINTRLACNCWQSDFKYWENHPGLMVSSGFDSSSFIRILRNIGARKVKVKALLFSQCNRGWRLDFWKAMYGSGFGKTGKPGLVKLGNHQGRRISLVNDLSKSYSKQMIIDSKCLPRRNSSFFCSEYSTAAFFRFAYGIYEINWVFEEKKISFVGRDLFLNAWTLRKVFSW